MFFWVLKYVIILWKMLTPETIAEIFYDICFFESFLRKIDKKYTSIALKFMILA